MIFNNLSDTLNYLPTDTLIFQWQISGRRSAVFNSYKMGICDQVHLQKFWNTWRTWKIPPQKISSSRNIWHHVLLWVVRNSIFYLLKSFGYKKYNMGKKINLAINVFLWKKWLLEKEKNSKRMSAQKYVYSNT